MRMVTLPRYHALDARLFPLLRFVRYLRYAVHDFLFLLAHENGYIARGVMCRGIRFSCPRADGHILASCVINVLGGIAANSGRARGPAPRSAQSPHETPETPGATAAATFGGRLLTLCAPVNRARASAMIGGTATTVTEMTGMRLLRMKFHTHSPWIGSVRLARLLMMYILGCVSRAPACWPRLLFAMLFCSRIRMRFTYARLHAPACQEGPCSA